ncbi:o-succinylbenzoate--CoA ligase [[Leptolyngbya] sp. PCC 7376]|uniref:AMP-binding protein n=1 Tax=[Leptolyngbya] sp. PCC 7376 TaxID=111781 RepID=UPI00029F356B|nr:AMP-binding protein [[Leptolyngbya] sp. PCC 7376]AFY39349.1 o-succinylbenzoate--CoA ligase [[Leptolyngbya] sp. PCC 7376]
MNLFTLLEQQAIAQPTVTAIIEGHNKRTSFATLVERSARGAAFLEQYGLKKGDAVLVFCPMSAELYIILGALWRLGLLALFIEPSATAKQFQQCCDLCKPKAMIAPSFAFTLLRRSPSLRRIPHKLTLDMPFPTANIWWTSRCWQPKSKIIDCEPEHPALLTFTSGSTGNPKAAVRSHGFLLKQYQILAKYLQPKPQQIELTHLPIFALVNLASGRTTIIPQGKLQKPAVIAPKPIIRQIQRKQPTSILASPAFLERLLDECQRKNIALPSVRQIFSGGAPIMPRLLRRLQQFMPAASIHILYGSTEAEPISILSHAQHQLSPTQKGLCVGQPIPDIQVKVLPLQNSASSYSSYWFKAICLAPNQVGEIVVAGDHVLNSYLQGAGDRHTKIQVGETIWHRTGDAGYFDENNQLLLVGRCDECRNAESSQLYPFVLETFLQQHPQVKRAAAIHYAGKNLIFIEPVTRKTRPAPQELQELLPQPHEIHFIRKMPVDRCHNGKILYRKLLTKTVALF